MTSNNANPHHYSLSDGDLKRSVDEACANDLSIELPVRFIVELSVAPDIDTIMQVIARWSRVIFRADRVTIALPVDATHLRLVAMEGNDAIPLDMPVPIAGTMVGRVFAQGKAEICPDLTLSEDWDCKMLTSKGLQSCLDVPLLSGSRCFGTINIGHCHRNAQDVADLIRLQAMAHWVASWLRIHHQVDEMRTLADIDPLTGALNRRAFARKFAAMSADWDARGDPKKAQLGIAMIDLDHFKAINDRYGHSAGDRVLIRVKEALADSCRDGDLIARMGGEEFCVAIPDISQPGMLTVLDRFTKAIESVYIPEADQHINVTASIGALLVQSKMDDQDKLLSLVDGMMYRAKESGRNRVLFYQ